MFRKSHTCNDLYIIQSYANELIAKACEVEYVVNVCISEEAHVWCLKCWLVGFEEEMENLRNQLMKGTKMARCHINRWHAKKTLAYRHYSDRLVDSPFYIRAQCCVSQVYLHKDMLLVILPDSTIDENSECRENR